MRRWSGSIAARPPASGSSSRGAVLGLALLAAAAPAPVSLPGGAGGIGFDDLRFSSELRAVLVPAGRTGRVDLVRGGEGRIASLAIFGSVPSRGRGHEDGTTSADVGQGYVFAIDRTTRVLAAVDPGSRRVVARAELAGGPDYVRWVGATREVWVTEPDRAWIETFRFDHGTLTRTGTVAVPGGPESLVVDAPRRRAYTNTFADATVAIDVGSRSIAARWPNRCRGARGLALDPDRGWLFVGCAEGMAVSLDVGHGGEEVGAARAGAGVDVIDFGRALSHLYVPGASEASLTVMAVDGKGALRALGEVATAPGAHCVAADDAGNVYVCDPRRGRLLTFRDPYPASR